MGRKDKQNKPQVASHTSKCPLSASILSGSILLVAGEDVLIEKCGQNAWCEDCITARKECAWCKDEVRQSLDSR